MTHPLSDRINSLPVSQTLAMAAKARELRAEGKKRDDLQEAISAIEAIDIGLPIEFVNFRD